MPEIQVKDKLITLEELGTAYNNITPANIGAVAKSGDTMTGTLTTRSIELAPASGAGNGGYIDFKYNGENIDNTSRIIESARGFLNINGVTFQNGNLTGNTNGYVWDPNTEDTSNTWVPVFNQGVLQHRVLPSWLNNINTVSVDHGGTGATDAAGARTNLHAMQNPDDSLTGHSADNVNNADAGFSVWYGGCVNNPFSFHASVLTIAAYPGRTYIQQIAFPWDDAETRIAYRVCNGGTWYPWRYITMS